MKIILALLLLAASVAALRYFIELLCSAAKAIEEVEREQRWL